MLIRQANLDDMQILLQFEQGVITAERPFDDTLKPGPINYYDLHEFITSPDVELLVAEEDGKLIGVGYARIKTTDKNYYDYADYAYLGFMYVKPEYRGKGINQMIIERLKLWAVQRGLSEIRLQVYSDNEPAIKAYEKVGFKKDLVEMRLRLK